MENAVPPSNAPTKPRFRLALVLLLSLPLAAVGTTRKAAADPTPKAAWEALRAETLTKLQALADMAAKSKLFRSRDQVFEGILKFDPDDKRARKFLKFRRVKGGDWERRGRYTPPRNSGKGVDAFTEARTALGAWFAEQTEELIENAELDDDTRTVAAIHAAAVGVDPERPSFRAWVGEVADTRKEGRWILRATELARARRPGIRATAEKALASMADPEPTTATAADRRGNVPWTALLQTERMRILGMPDISELTQSIKFAEAAWPVFEYAFDRRPGDIRGRGERRLTLYTFDTLEAGNAFLEVQPGLDAERKVFLAPLAACGLPGRAAVLIKSTEAPTRIEAAARQPNHSFVRRQFGLRKHNAWMREAAFVYLTYQVTKTRLISSVAERRSDYAQPDVEQPEYETRLSDGDADWYALGLQMMRSKDKPDIRLLPGKDINKLTKMDVLYGWCILSFLIEGNPEKAAEVLGMLGSEHGTAVDSVFIDALGYDTKTLEERVIRWLGETRDV